MKIYKILFMTLLMAVFINGCGSANNGGISGESVAPTVTSTNPAEGDTDVFLNRKIAVAFSEEMAPASETTFTLMQGTTAVSGTVASSGIDAVFTPTSNLAASTLYTATITTGAMNLSGNALASDYVWSFTTGTTTDTSAPTVSSTNPDNAALSVAINRQIAATFSEEMNALTITSSTFLLTGPGTTPVTGTVGYALGGNVAIFTPASDLAANTLFTATLTTGTQDLSGNVLASNYVWTFTTGDTADTTAPTITSTNPADTDTSVAINKTVTATFSEAMDALTITTANYTVTGPGTTAVAGTVDYDLTTNVATFTPGSNLAPNTLFTATITTGAQDLASNSLASNYVWTFTTGTEAAQTIAQDAVPLGTAARFAILASAGVTDIPTSIITGDVGLTPDAGSNITGFSSPLTCPEVTLQGGNIFAVDATGPGCAIDVTTTADPTTGLVNPALISDAKTDALAAFNNANVTLRNGATPGSISTDLGGLTLYPGLYESLTTIELHGDLYLDAQGDSNAVFIIRSSTSITTFNPSEVHLTKGAKASNVYWTAGSAITIGSTSIMKGTMIAGTAITLQTGANLEGRALNQGPSAAAISLDSSTITLPSP